MLLAHNHIAIFSQPRTGTKLLAKILENFGYHTYGEWYANASTKIQGDTAIRREKYLPLPDIMPQRQYVNSTEFIKRYQQLSDIEKKYPRSVATIWPQSLFEFPFIITQFVNHHWVCVKRNPWDQILSFYISYKNQNFDATRISNPIIFREDIFRKMYWDYYTVDGIQQWMVSNQQATVITFDELVHGTSKVFGTTYKITSKDEHNELEQLVQNLDEVKIWFDNFEYIRTNSIDNK
jgi:hypothetical protein